MPDQSTGINWMPFRSASSSLTIPAFAPLQVVGTTIQDGVKLILTCDQIGSSYHPGFNLNIAFNGPISIAPGGYGICARGSDACQTLWDTGTPAPGDIWGIKPGQFSLTKGGLGYFLVDGIVDTGTKRMYGRWLGIQALVGQLYGDLPALSGSTPGSQTLNLYYNSGGSLTNSGWTTTIYNYATGIIKQKLNSGSNKFVQGKYIGGQLVADTDDCYT